jgi:hypothetical protein
LCRFRIAGFAKLGHETCQIANHALNPLITVGPEEGARRITSKDPHGHAQQARLRR